MPVSAYLEAGLFVVAAAAALFSAAGTIAIPGFWAYLAIFRHDRFVRGARSGPSARAHAAGRQEAAARAENLLARSVHALDRCRARPWPFSLERQRARLAARRLPVRGRGRLRPGTMGYAREPVFLLSHSHPDRPRPTRYHHGTLRLRPPSWIHRRDSDYSGKRTRTRIVVRGRAACDLQ